MKALVTGGAGFIGHHLVGALLERDDTVVVLDDFSTGFRERLGPHADRVRIVEGSILDPSILDDAAAGCDVVFHEAALALGRAFVRRPRVAPTRSTWPAPIEVVLAAARAGVRRIVFAASSSVYGVPEELPCRESMKPTPESPYGVSKLAGEYYLHTLGRRLGVETVALRYFNVFGPGQDPNSHYAAVIPLFITAVLEGRRPTINGDGSVTRDFTYVDNVVAANLAAASALGASGRTMNIACGDRTSLLELLEPSARWPARAVEPIFGPPRPGDIKHSLADVSAAREAPRLRGDVPFREGIEDGGVVPGE